MLFTNKKEELEEDKEVNILKEVVGMIIYILVIIILIYLILHYLGQRTEVKGHSMENTLYDTDSLWIDKLSYRFHDPERFDIIVFPYDEATDTYYIKRIIGLPGETVYINPDGQIFIDGELLEENYGEEVIAEYRIGRAADTVTLGDDEYFVMGDNRNNSQDSRTEEVGNIKREEITGKAVFRLWPFSRFGTID